MPEQTPSHDAVQRRPLTAPSVHRSREIFREMPHPECAVTKNAQLARIRAGADGSGESPSTAAAPDEARRPRPIRMRIHPDYVPDEVVQGRVSRRAMLGRDGQPVVRTVFKPDDRGQRRIWLQGDRMEGVANGARVEVAPGEGSEELCVRPLCGPVPNMVGTLELDTSGRVSVVALTPLSARSRVVVTERDAEKLRERIVGASAPLLALIDLDPRSPSPVGIFHDFVEANRMQQLELDAGLSVGVAGTFDAAELAQAERIAASEPLAVVPEGLLDLRDEIDFSTDNPGSHTDHASADPEQAATVFERDDRFVVKYKLAYARPLVPDESPIARHSAEYPQTYYASGFDLPANPRSLNMDKAVLLEGKARYAVTVECHVDKATGQPIFEDCGAYECVVENDWQGSYRDAEVYYELQRPGLSEARRAELEAVLPALEQGEQEQLDLALRAHERIRQAYIDDGGLLVGARDGYVAEDIIHSFSTTANEVLGALNAKAGAPAVYRVHEPGRLEDFADYTKEVGIPWDHRRETLAEYLSALPQRVPQDQPWLAEIIGKQAIRHTARARYSATETGHFGMGKRFYAHGSASNRLVSGIVNLANAVASTRILAGESGVAFPYSQEQAEQFAARQTELEIRIGTAEAAQRNIRDALALEPYVGRERVARILELSRHGMALETREPVARVFIPMTHLKQALQARYDIESPLALRLGKRRFEVGQVLEVRIEHASPALRFVSAMLADLPRSWATRERRR